MEPRWTTAEEELLITLVHSIDCGSFCRVVRSWKEVADLMDTRAAEIGIRRRLYTKTNVAYHYAQMPKGNIEQIVRAAATRTAEAGGSGEKSAKALIPCGEGCDTRNLPAPLLSLPKVLEGSAQATGPPKDFEKCKDQRRKRSGKRG